MPSGSPPVISAASESSSYSCASPLASSPQTPTPSVSDALPLCRPVMGRGLKMILYNFVYNCVRVCVLGGGGGGTTFSEPDLSYLGL